MGKPPIHLFEQCCWDLRGVLTRFGPDEACCDGLTPRQCRILRAVGEEPDLRLSEIAARENLTPGGLTRRIQPLVKGGWLERRAGAGNDGRAATLELTAKGRSALHALEKQIYSAVEDLWSSVPASQRPTVLAGLKALVEAARRNDAKR